MSNYSKQQSCLLFIGFIEGNITSLGKLFEMNIIASKCLAAGSGSTTTTNKSRLLGLLQQPRADWTVWWSLPGPTAGGCTAHWRPGLCYDRRPPAVRSDAAQPRIIPRLRPVATHQLENNYLMTLFKAF